MGAPNLWPDTLSASTPSAETSRSSQPAACTASVWNGHARGPAEGADPAMGWMVPTSLFAYITVHSVVSSRSAASSASTRTVPAASTGTGVASKPWNRTR